MGLFGTDRSSLGAITAGSWYVQAPPSAWNERQQVYTEPNADPLVEWCANAEGILRREKTQITEEMTAAMNLYKGGTPWWSKRPRWKIGKRLNWCYWVPQKWTQVLNDSYSKINYAAYKVEDQRFADIATAAIKQAAIDGEWDRIKRSIILNSQIQKKAFGRLTPEIDSNGCRAVLTLVTGEQIFVDRNAHTIDDAEVIMYEYPKSANYIFSKWPKLRAKMRGQRRENQGHPEDTNRQEVLSPSTQQLLPTGNSVTNAPYTAQSNPPDNAGSTSGFMVREFWTFPKKTTKVSSVKFTVAGDPVTQEKYTRFKDGSEDPLRRVITEGNIIYEWPQSFVDIVVGMEELGGLRILKDMQAVEVVKDDKEYLLYPFGRLTIIVDNQWRAEDRMNPLGYTPFIEIESNPDCVFWGQSNVDIIADAYEYYIRLLCSLLDAANLTSNPVWRILLSEEISDDDITNAPGAIMRETMMSLKLSKREPGPDMPPYVMQLLQRIEDTIMKLSNLSEIATGQAKFKGQQSAETVSMYQDTAAVSFRDALGSIQRFDVKLGNQFVKLMSRFYTTPQLVSVKNAAGVDESIPFLGTHFVTPLRTEAKPGSSMPNSPTARLNMMLNMVQSGQPLVDLPEVWSLFEQVGYIDSASALERRIEKEMADPRQAWKVPGRPQQQQQGAKQAKKANGRRSNKKQG
jgi:hypothetical protein